MKTTATRFAALALTLALAALLAPPAAAAASGLQLVPQSQPLFGLPSRPSVAAANSLTPRTASLEPACADGIVYDDGSVESTIRFTDGDGDATEVDLVMRIDVGEVGRRLDQVCICWTTVESGSPNLEHDLVFYAANGPGGAPGTMIGNPLTFQLQGIPAFPSTSFFDYDVSGDNVVTTTQSIYVGARWIAGDEGGPGHTLCSDDNGGADQPIFVANSGVNNWTNVDSLFLGTGFEPPDAILIRANPAEEVVEESCPTTPCVEDVDTMCLNDDRFRVEADWATDQGTSGFGNVGELTLSDTNYFWFFNQNNVEVVVKVLNGCGVNQRYWVFAGGLTNVEVELRVCDTQAGIQRTYSNPQTTPFQPIQDTGAFATCP